MLKNTLIIALVIVIIYLYYSQKKTNLTGNGSNSLADKNLQTQLETVQGANLVLTAFLKNNLNSNSLEELKTKLDSKTLDEILEANSDWETEVDTLTRTKNSLEQDLTAQSNAFQSRLKEKEREVKKLKEDLKDLEKVRENLTSEKQQHKGSLERISLLTEQINKLEKMPGQFPPSDKSELVQEHQAQLRKINTLFDENAKDYEAIDFNGLYGLLEKVAEEQKKKKKNSRAGADLQPTKEEKTLAEFRNWINEDEEKPEIMSGVDWNFYHSKKDWVVSFKKWNSLRTDRLDLLEEWLNKD